MKISIVDPAGYGQSSQIGFPAPHFSSDHSKFHVDTIANTIKTVSIPATEPRGPMSQPIRSKLRREIEGILRATGLPWAIEPGQRQFLKRSEQHA